LAEFCDGDFRVVLGTPENIRVFTLAELLPLSFGKGDLK
jgi:cytidine deaminase